METGKIWWGKTVGYRYVMTMGIDHFVAPLNGKEEAMADALVELNASWSLIEFKRTRSQFSIERRKYPEGEASGRRGIM
ncbi:hypothetical protein [Paraburkholderia phenazinium]|jgi:hypothetical protein|uniref:hypothetical protein n=1 Tax=Paraburkholderia phenazinium TaxID=60549 RepID=UPI0015899E41|nr:hypothetical protein [Paraburkholderia phenazinium]